MRSRNRLVKGVGINDVDLPTSTVINGKVVKDRFYLTWTNMLNRCYSPKYHETRPTYAGCTVCDEWLYFSKFKAWMEQQDWEGKHLDKDLLIGGNRIYSPNTCLFVASQVNSSLMLNGVNRGDYPIGCSFNAVGRNYKAECYNGCGRKIYLGYFETPIKAHRAWQGAKISSIDNLKDSQPDFLVKIGLQRIINKIQDDYDNYRETTNFD